MAARRFEVKHPTYDEFVRDVSDQAIVAITRAFERARLTVAGLPLTGPATGLQWGWSEQGDRVVVSQPVGRNVNALRQADDPRVEDRRFFALDERYRWYSQMLLECLFRSRPWTAIPNAYYDPYGHPVPPHTPRADRTGFNPHPPNTPEEELGQTIFAIGCRAREAAKERSTKRGHVRPWFDKLTATLYEKIRSRLNWPRIPDNFHTTPPGLWADTENEPMAHEHRGSGKTGKYEIGREEVLILREPPHCGVRGPFWWADVSLCLRRDPKAPAGGRPVLDSASEVARFMAAAMPDLALEGKEHAIVIPVDTQLRPLGIAHLSTGTLNAAMVSPREVVQIVTAVPAAGFFLVHNHPSGNAAVSNEDKAVGNRMQAVSEIMNLRFLDMLAMAPQRDGSWLWEATQSRDAGSVPAPRGTPGGGHGPVGRGGQGALFARENGASSTRYQVSRHALGQRVQGALGVGGIEWEVLDSYRRSGSAGAAEIVFISRSEENAIAEARRLNREDAAGTVSRGPIAGQTTYLNGDLAVYTGRTEEKHGALWYELALVEGRLKGQRKVTGRAPDPSPLPAHSCGLEKPLAPGQAQCSVCLKVGPKRALKKHEKACKSGSCPHSGSSGQPSLFGPQTPAEKDIARRIAKERKKGR